MSTYCNSIVDAFVMQSFSSAPSDKEQDSRKQTKFDVHVHYATVKSIHATQELSKAIVYEQLAITLRELILI